MSFQEPIFIEQIDFLQDSIKLTQVSFEYYHLTSSRPVAVTANPTTNGDMLLRKH